MVTVARASRSGLMFSLALVIGITLFIISCGGEATAVPAPAATTAPAATAVPRATSAPTKAPAAAATTRKEIVRLAVPTPDVESNRTWVAGWVYIVQHDVFAETLFGNDETTGEAFPLLAESWEVNDDFTTWSIKLREGIPFQFGWGDVTTADVVHTYNLLNREDSLASLKYVWETADLEVIDDYNINFHFELPYIDGTRLFSRHAGDLIIVSKAQFDAQGFDAFDNIQTAGTGPYQLVSRELGVNLLYERVPEGHWNYDVDFENFEFVWAAESLTRLAMLLAGEAQISQIERTLQPDAEARGMRVISSTQPSVQVASMFGGLYFRNTEKWPDQYTPGLPLDSLNVRKALNKAIDRDAILEEIYLGRATPVYRFAFNPLNEGWNPEWETRWEEEYGYDPDAARALLALEGYGPDNPLKIKSVTTAIPGSPELHDVTEAIQIMFANVNVEMSIEKLDFGEWLARLRGHEYTNTFVPTRNTPIRTTELGVRSFLSDGGNWWGFAHPFINEKYECLRTTADAAVRQQCALDLGNFAYENHTDSPLFELTHDMTVNPEFIAGWVYPGLSSAGITHFHNIKAVQ